VLLDGFSRKVVGWALDKTLATRLPLAALHQAITTRQPPPGVVHHSDRGIQGGLKWSSQHILCWPIGATGQAPLQAFSNPAFFEAWR